MPEGESEISVSAGIEGRAPTLIPGRTCDDVEAYDDEYTFDSSRESAIVVQGTRVVLFPRSTTGDGVRGQRYMEVRVQLRATHR